MRRQQVSGPTAILFLEQVWNRDLSDLDPDGPLPDVDPGPDPLRRSSEGRANVAKDPLPTAREWRELADGQRTVDPPVDDRGDRPAVLRRHPVAAVAERIDTYVQADAADGFILVPHVTPGGLDAVRRPRWSPSCRNAAITAPSTPAPPCASTSTCRRCARGPAHPNAVSSGTGS